MSSFTHRLQLFPRKEFYEALKEHDDKLSIGGRTTGCLKKAWTVFENAITPLFMEKTFPSFLWL